MCKKYWYGSVSPVTYYLQEHRTIRKYLATQHKEDKDILETVQQWAKIMIKILEHLSHKEGLKELGLFSIKKAGLRGVLSMCMKNEGGHNTQ